MTDLDERLSQDLKAVSAAMRRARATRPLPYQDLLKRYRRRRATRAVTGAVAVVAVAGLAFFVTTSADVFHHARESASGRRGVAATYIATGRNPSGVSAGGGAVWVASSDGYLIEIDPATDRGIVRVPVGGRPSDVALTRDAVWYSDSSDGGIRRIDAATSEFSGPPVFVDAYDHIDIDVGPQGTVWATDHDSGALVGIDSATAAAVKRFPVAAPVELGIGGRAIWALVDDGARLVRFDFATSAESLDVPVDSTAKTDLAIAAGAVFVAEADGTIVELDPETGARISTHSLRGTDPELAVAGGGLWVAYDAGAGRGELVELDPAGLDVVRSPRAFVGAPTDIALGSHSAWVTESTRDTVVRLRLPTG